MLKFSHIIFFTKSISIKRNKKIGISEPKKNKLIPVNKIGRGKQITRDDIYFDMALKYISIKSYTREELLKLWFEKQNNIKN